MGGRLFCSICMDGFPHHERSGNRFGGIRCAQAPALLCQIKGEGYLRTRLRAMGPGSGGRSNACPTCPKWRSGYFMEIRTHQALRSMRAGMRRACVAWLVMEERAKRPRLCRTNAALLVGSARVVSVPLIWGNPTRLVGKSRSRTDAPPIMVDVKLGPSTNQVCHSGRSSMGKPLSVFCRRFSER